MSIKIHAVCPKCQNNGQEGIHFLLHNDDKTGRMSYLYFKCGKCEEKFPGFLLDEHGEIEQMNLRNEDGSLYEIPDYSEHTWFMPKDK